MSSATLRKYNLCLKAARTAIKDKNGVQTESYLAETNDYNLISSMI